MPLMKLTSRIFVIFILAAQVSFCQSEFQKQQKRIFDKVASYDSGVTRVNSITFGKIRFRGHKVRMVYQSAKNLYLKKHHTYYKKGHKIEWVSLYSLSQFGDKVLYLKLKKIDEHYVYIDDGTSKLIVNEYLSTWIEDNGVKGQKYFYNHQGK
jgi:hypothetical protein